MKMLIIICEYQGRQEHPAKHMQVKQLWNTNSKMLSWILLTITVSGYYNYNWVL